LILGKISKSDDIRCQILRLKCTKFDFRWGYAPDPAGGAYSTLPDPLAVFKGPSSKGRDFRKGRIAVRKGTEKSKGREWKGSEGEKREGEGKGFTGLMSNCFPRAVKRVSGTTQASRYQKGKTNLDFTEARDSEWQWHPSWAICMSAPRSRQTTTPASHHSGFTGRTPFLPPN